MITTIRLAIAGTVAAVALTGCAVWSGADLTGVVETQTLDVGEFTAVAVDGAADVVITTGDAVRVEVTGDTALLEEVRAEVRDGTLVLAGPSWNLGWSDADVTYAITAPSLDGIEVSGSGNVDATLEGAGDVAIDVSGSGDVALAGSGESLRIGVDGSGDVDTSRFSTATATVDLSGSGDVTVAASQELTVDLSGSGDVTSTGSGAVRADVSGSGDVRER